MIRTTLKSVSSKRRKTNAIRKANLESAWGPRPWSCYLTHKQGQFQHARDNSLTRIPFCIGQVDAHELLKRSQGGSITEPSNMVPLCSGHNSWVEDNPKISYELGLVRHSWE